MTVKVMAKGLKKVRLIELNEAYQKVLYWFFSFPDLETGLNDLSSDLKIAKTTAKRIVNIMEREGFLAKRVYGKTWRVSCNKKHYYNFTHKIVFNLAMLYKAYEECIRESILKVVGNPKSVTLFGSYRKGDDTEKSDIDIAVEISGNEAVRIVELGIIPMFGYRQNVQVNLYIFSRNKVDLNLFSNIANGIVLEGFLEVKP